MFISVKYPNIPNDMILELADANMHDDLAKAREEMTERALKFQFKLLIFSYKKFLSRNQAIFHTASTRRI